MTKRSSHFAAFPLRNRERAQVVDPAVKAKISATLPPRQQFAAEQVHRNRRGGSSLHAEHTFDKIVSDTNRERYAVVIRQSWRACRIGYWALVVAKPGLQHQVRWPSWFIVKTERSEPGAALTGPCTQGVRFGKRVQPPWRSPIASDWPTPGTQSAQWAGLARCGRWVAPRSCSALRHGASVDPRIGGIRIASSASPRPWAGRFQRGQPPPPSGTTSRTG